MINRFKNIFGIVIVILFCNKALAMMDTKQELKITKLYAAANGDSKFEELTINVDHKHQLGFYSDPYAVKGLIFRKMIPSTYYLHTAPKEQYIIYLKGTAEIEVTSGEKRIFGPGDILLVTDTTGKGHKTTILTEGVSLVIPVQ